MNGGNATFIAGHKISFLPGFLANEGSHMHGYITTNGQYCNIPAAPLLGYETTCDDDQLNGGSSLFKVYPNPTTGNFMVELTGKKSSEKIQVAIFTLQGEKLMMKELAGKGVYQIEISDHPAGVYFIRIVSANKTETAKMIKQ
jgi:hypothetical protein